MSATTQRQDAKAKHPNEGIDLSAFDYSKMQGSMYSKYLDLVEGKVIDEDDPLQRRAGGLDAQKKYVFEAYKVRAVYKRLYPKSQVDTSMELRGFELVTGKPERITCTFLKDVILLNGQLSSKQNTGTFNNTTGPDPIYTYYLLQPAK